MPPIEEPLGPFRAVRLGRRDYASAWALQKEYHAKRVRGEVPDTLLLVEHDPVITLGKSAKQSNLLVPTRLLAERGIACHAVERGGDVTYHGPGQLVGYPIFNIRHGFAGIKPFVNTLEETIIATLARYGVKGFRREKHIGVWADAGKICSIGIAVKQWVAFHGFALNVTTDLSHFDLIVPCGLPGVVMTSISRITGCQPDLDDVADTVIQELSLITGRKAVAT